MVVCLVIDLTGKICIQIVLEMAPCNLIECLWLPF